MVNVKEKLSLVSRAPDLKRPVSLTTVCGSSSWFDQVTVVPTVTISVVGANMKLFATTTVAAEVVGPGEAHRAGNADVARHAARTIDCSRFGVI